VIVYGDPSFNVSIPSSLAWLREDFTGATLDEWRAALIAAGQLEQAAEDWPDASQVLREAARSLTDAAAEGFYGRCMGGEPDATAFRNVLAHPAFATDILPKFKLPESFAFYALYPEQFIGSVERFIADHPAPAHVALIGIRSIGTSLSAICARVFIAHSWQVTRFTVRPTGHPFSRVSEIDAAQLAGAEYALIVDEGPGLSGSSMASVVEALERVGFAQERIAFFATRAGMLGHAASDTVRAIWERTPRYLPSEARFDGLALPEALVEASRRLYLDDPVVKCEDIGGGGWRRIVYADEAEWPPAFAPFERPKYLVTLASRKRILWKFEGLCSDEAGYLAKFEFYDFNQPIGFTKVQVPSFAGFLAWEWVTGKTPSRADLSWELMQPAGSYMRAVKGDTLSEEEQKAALDRLIEMVYWNTWESLGEPTAQALKRWMEAARAALPATPPRFEDGRFAPHDFVIVKDGEWLKIRHSAHALDHTWIGKQSATWDPAGMIIEWALDDDQTKMLLAYYEAVPVDELRFYCVAYAAFKVGMTALCAGMWSNDADEKARLDEAYVFYLHQLRVLTDKLTTDARP